MKENWGVRSIFQSGLWNVLIEVSCKKWYSLVELLLSSLRNYG